MLNAVQQLAGAIGVAMLGTVFFGQIAHGGFAHALHAAMWVALGFLAAVTRAVVRPAALGARERSTAVGAPAPEAEAVPAA